MLDQDGLVVDIELAAQLGAQLPLLMDDGLGCDAHACAFAGWLEWLGPQELTVTGGSLGAQGAEGTVATTIEGARFDEIWTGAWEGDQLAGSFSGEVALALGGRDYELRYEGSFTAHRVP